MLAKLNAAADKWLRARGIRSEPSRRALRALAALAAASLAVGLALIWLTPQIVCFGVGAALALLNLFCLSGTVGRVVARPTEAALRFRAGIFVFFRITATVAILLLILWHMPRAAFGLLAGFAASMMVLALSGLIRSKNL